MCDWTTLDRQWYWLERAFRTRFADAFKEAASHTQGKTPPREPSLQHRIEDAVIDSRVNAVDIGLALFSIGADFYGYSARLEHVTAVVQDTAVLIRWPMLAGKVKPLANPKWTGPLCALGFHVSLPPDPDALGAQGTLMWALLV
jgi:hypothetical protein